MKTNAVFNRARSWVLILCALLAPVPLYAEHEGKVQVLLVGDSTTEGSVPRRLRPAGPHLEDVVRMLLAAEKDLPPCNIVNLGLSGEYVRRLLDSGRYDKQVAKQPGVDYIFLRYGLNDHNKREGFAENYTKDYAELITKLRRDHPEAKLVIMTVIPYMDAAVSAKINALNRQVAEREKLPLFDIYPRYAAELKKGRNMLNYRRYDLKKIPVQHHELVKSFLYGTPPKVEVMDNQLDAHFGSLAGWFDDRHPNLAGYHVIGDETAKYLAAMIRADAEKKTGATFDLIIKNAVIVDGTGRAPFNGGLGIRDGRITAVGEVQGQAKAELDAQGRVVAPGFIDVHTHSEKIGVLPEAENFLRMGVTTIVTGNCGYSRTDVAGFFEEIEKAQVSLHVATLIGHGSVREKGMGGRFIRAPNAEQLEVMKDLVDQAMHDGALGLSTGLIYVPGTLAKTEEIIALARVAAGYDGVYASHMRYETNKIFTALDELTRVAREAGIRADVSHIKLSGPSAWGRAGEVLAYLDKARKEGLRITHDQYAYTASSTGLRQTLPDSALEGTHGDFIARLDHPEEKAKIIKGMKNILTSGGRTNYSYVVISRFPVDPSLNGLTIPEAAQKVRGAATLEDQIELLLDMERRGGVVSGGSGVFHGMSEDDLRVFLQHPLTMVASDGGPRLLGEDVPHPRSYGNNARILARYVREQKVLSLEEAVRRMTSLPATTFGIKERGALEKGAWADVVIFDPEQVKDTALFNDPHHYAEGFTDVLVDGVPVIREGRLTEARPGGPLRR